MNKFLHLFILALFFATTLNAQTTYYYKLTRKIVNGNSNTNVSGGQYISFVDGKCYESDKEGFSVDNGVMKYDSTNGSSGNILYIGNAYWGQCSFVFNSDKTKLNVRVNDNEIYVYQKATAPVGQVTCSLIKNNSSNSSTAIVSAGPIGVSQMGMTTTNGGMSQQNHHSERTPSKRWRTVTRDVDCTHCAHSGKCNSCYGKGYYYSSFGVSKTVDCPNCYGYKTGLCRYCQGKGTVTKTERVYE